MSALPIAALIAGPIAMGTSPIFVRMAEVGPFASAFWRVGLALPFFLIWWALENKSPKRSQPIDFKASLKAAFWPGVFFAGDLFFWHLAIMNTSIANAAFFATLAPIAVVFGAAIFLHERLTMRLCLGLGLAVAGAGLLLGNSFVYARTQILGDIYGLITAGFFAAYMLSVKAARTKLPPGKLMFYSCTITSLILFAVVLIANESLVPQTIQGFASLASLALVSQVGGQGLLAYALGHLPAIFSSLVIFLEPLAAAFLGWSVLEEALAGLQGVGGICIILGIYVARPKKPRGFND